MGVTVDGLSPCEVLRRRLGCLPDELVGESTAHRTMLEELCRVASRRFNVLLVGPTGVGKTSIAAVLHRASKRKGPFVSVNAASLVSTIADSQLFGHADGAFTGARATEGLVAAAHGGTLFIDEIADLDIGIQAKLLTFLDRGRFRGIGTDERSANVRLITATNRELSLLRPDLVARIAKVTIEVPPLSARPSDILRLAEILLCRMAAEDELESIPLALDAETALLARTWPNNMRELEQVLIAGDMRARDIGSRRILGEHLFPGSPDAGSKGCWKERMATFQKVTLRTALRDANGRHADAATSLGLPDSTFYDHLRRLEVGSDEAFAAPRRSRAARSRGARSK